MRVSALISFILVTAIVSSTASAQLQYYGIDARLDENGKSSVKLTFTFSQPEKSFNFTILGRINDFNATSIAGPVECTTTIYGTSYISCDLPLTQEKRTVEMTFDTMDFTKSLGGKFLFSADLTINQKVDNFFLSITLPEGMALSDEDKLSFAENATKVSDGRHIIITWRMNDLDIQPLVFQAVYEPFSQSSYFILYLAAGIVVVSTATVFIIRKMRKPQEVILSVLDDYERSVMKIINEVGEINQRKVVQATNLSKAKVSRVVKSLEERGLIEVERFGRTNKLKVSKKKIWS